MDVQFQAIIYIKPIAFTEERRPPTVRATLRRDVRIYVSTYVSKLREEVFVPSKKSDELSRLTLSITVEDKRILKQVALDNDTTVAALVHEWVQKTYGKQNKQTR